MHSGSMSAPYQGKTQACTCASPGPTLLEGELAAGWEGDVLHLDPPCTDTRKWAVQCSTLSETHVFELSWRNVLRNVLRNVQLSKTCKVELMEMVRSGPARSRRLFTSARVQQCNPGLMKGLS